MRNLSIIGLGKLGSPMAAVFAVKGYNVIGVDKNQHFVDQINQGIPPVTEPELQDYITKGQQHLSATTDMNHAIQNSDATFVIVPTPSGADGIFTNKYVIDAMTEIGAALKNKTSYHLVVITSTVMPGSTGGEIREALEKASGKKLGDSLGLCYSPEFIALGSVIRNMLYPDFYLIGESDKKAGDLLEMIYLHSSENRPFVKRMNFVNAELAKISVNTYVTTKISYANMLSEICDYLPEADVDVVTDAIGCDSRIGIKYLKGGVAYGGPCFPRDNVAFNQLARILNVKTDIAKATDSINHHQTQRVLNIIQSLAQSKKRVSILGLSYKPNTPVIEESQGIALAIKLISAGFDVSVYDPVSMPPAEAILGNKVTYADSLKSALNDKDIIVLMTAWDEFRGINESMFESTETQVIDCWRLLETSSFESMDLIHLGKGYFPEASQTATRAISKAG